MKIISWNCNMAFRNKIQPIINQTPDLLIVQECEYYEKYSSLKSRDKIWIGDNKNKGLGVFSFSDFNFQIHNSYNPGFKYILPIEVTGKIKFNLFAIWAMNDKKNPQNRYIAQVWLALNYYKDLLKQTSIIVGDFNSNVIWDNEKLFRVANHSKVVNFLEENYIYSTYHNFFKEKQGIESKPTLYMYRNENKSYHIDYCFVSQDLIDKLEYVNIGSYNDWAALSDHVPLEVSFKE